MKHKKRTDIPRLSEQLSEDPEILLDAVLKKLCLRSDAALSRALDVAPPVISKIRNRKLPVGYAILLRILEATNLTVRELHKLSTDETPIAPETVSNNGMPNARVQLRPRRSTLASAKSGL